MWYNVYVKIPPSLKLGGHTIKVVFAVLEKCNGESDFATNTITIDSSLTKSQQESTLFHEILHFSNSTLDDSELGHALLDALAEQLYQVFSDNKMLK